MAGMATKKWFDKFKFDTVLMLMVKIVRFCGLYAQCDMSKNLYPIGLVWLRRDLRVHDHAALAAALAQCRTVFVAFIFDKTILDVLPSKQDRRVEFIWQSVTEVDLALRKHGGQLLCQHAIAEQAIPRLALELNATAVFTNHDYEPQAIMRDERVREQLRAHDINLHTFKDQVVFEKSEVLTASQTPFSVFTPYKNAWRKRFDQFPAMPFECVLTKAQLSAQVPASLSSKVGIPSLQEMDFKPTNLNELKIHGGSAAGLALLHDFADRINHYRDTRDYPAVKGPSYLSVHFRFGTISIREAVKLALSAKNFASNEGAQTWLAELIWREFYFQILHHHPRVAERAFKPDYDNIAWERDEALFAAWKEGRTGYPLVDAAMMQLNQTGYMHNRLRMVVASFLMKDLGIDWRWGEQYFADQLNDFDLSANNGGWQWAASSGCDAQPYFRIFNPITQSEKFDAEGKFIKRYLPQLAGLSKKTIHAPWLAGPIELTSAQIKLGENYPHPIVAHDVARAKTLERYAVVKRSAEV
jgi:deoxyribodipyrimidine photo-lyase